MNLTYIIHLHNKVQSQWPVPLKPHDHFLTKINKQFSYVPNETALHKK